MAAVCACGCGRSLEGRRRQTMWFDADACRMRAKRAGTEASDPGHRVVNVVAEHADSVREAIRLAERHTGHVHYGGHSYGVEARWRATAVAA